ncbi:MAG: hypothetical protein J5710_09140 [Treponema sp.]|nr:hypothetical protein [Treponema sp.]
MADDVIFLTGWDSEAQLIKNKKINWPVAVKKYYPEDFEEFVKNKNIKISGTMIPVEGDVFIKNPFLNNVYLSFDEAEKEIINSKAQCLSEILQFLGATSFKTYSYKNSYESIEKNVTLSTKVNKTVKSEDKKNKKQQLVGIDAEYHSSNSNSKKLKYIREETYDGTYSLASYEKAKMIAEKYGLLDNLDIQGLLEKRNPNNTNFIKSQKISINMSSEFNKSRELVLGLQALNVSLKSGYNKILHTFEETVYEIDVKF